ncbi:chymotrypsin-like protease CTRL-1 [Haliotis cracherodii]|uniref:chymotrypsin-like protease CTRL-1 n=1 Tax=Haliotis cracherodii TaxID=6455 RepID=UPI0039EB3511
MTSLCLVLLALLPLAGNAISPHLQSRFKRATIQLGTSTSSSYCESLLDMADAVPDIDQAPLLQLLISQACSGIVILPDQDTTPSTQKPTTTTRTTTTTTTTTTAKPSTRTCGTVFSNGAATALRVINGEKVAKGEYQFLVSFLYLGEVVCTATIIDPTHVLTAAHCTIGLRARDLSVGIAEHDSTKKDGERIIDVRKVTQHPRYNDNTLVNDIAILTLKTPITGIKNAEPVCLPVNGQCGNLSNRNCVVAGWGAISQQGGSNTYPSSPFDATVQVYDGTACPLQAASPSDKKTQICAVGASDTCEGDSGGPLVCKFGGRWVQCGITSYGTRLCNTKNTQAIYTKVPAYNRWIQSILAS